MNDNDEEEYQGIKARVLQSFVRGAEKLIRYPIILDYSFFKQTLRKYYNNDKHIYAKYFIAKENENKSNLLILQSEITKRRYIFAFTVFFLYNGIKSILWNRGYLANFFFHTRMMSVAVLAMTLLLIRRDKEVYQINENLYRYSLKHNQHNRLKSEVELENIKKQAIDNKIKDNLNA